MRQSDGAGTATRESMTQRKIDQKSGDYDDIGISDWFAHNLMNNLKAKTKKTKNKKNPKHETEFNWYF